MKTVTVGDLQISNDKPFVLIAGPCAMESRDHALETAAALHEICGKLRLERRLAHFTCEIEERAALRLACLANERRE